MPKTVYQTQDGELFREYKEAEEHEKNLFNKWLDTNPLIDIKVLIEQAADSDNDEWYGTGRDFCVEVAKIAYESQNG